MPVDYRGVPIQYGRIVDYSKELTPPEMRALHKFLWAEQDVWNPGSGDNPEIEALVERMGWDKEPSWS